MKNCVTKMYSNDITVMERFVKIFQMVHKLKLKYILHGARGGVVAKPLRYKPVGRGFDSR